MDDYFPHRGIGLLSLLLLIGGTGAGCSSHPPRVFQAEVDIEEACRSAFVKYDSDSNGTISKEEADSFPAVQRHFALYDPDRDENVTTQEFKQALVTTFDPRAALITVDCIVTQKGKPLTGAVVRFVPEEFLGGAIPSAEGIVGANGNVILSIKTEDLPEGAPHVAGFIRPGLYRVVITHPSQEIPEKYNLETTLGETVSPQTLLKGTIRLALF